MKVSRAGAFLLLTLPLAAYAPSPQTQDPAITATTVAIIAPASGSTVATESLDEDTDAFTGLDDARTYIALVGLLVGLVGGGGIAGVISSNREKRRQQAEKVAAWLEDEDDSSGIYIRNNSDRAIRDVFISLSAGSRENEREPVFVVSTVGPLRTSKLPLSSQLLGRSEEHAVDIMFRDANGVMCVQPHAGGLHKAPKAQQQLRSRAFGGDVREARSGVVSDEAKDSVLGKFDDTDVVTTRKLQDYRVIETGGDLGHQIILSLRGPGPAAKFGTSILEFGGPDIAVRLSIRFDDSEERIVELVFHKLPSSPLAVMTEDSLNGRYHFPSDSLLLTFVPGEQITADKVNSIPMTLPRGYLGDEKLGVLMLAKDDGWPAAVLIRNARKRVRPNLLQLFPVLEAQLEEPKGMPDS